MTLPPLPLPPQAAGQETLPASPVPRVLPTAPLPDPSRAAPSPLPSSPPPPPRARTRSPYPARHVDYTDADLADALAPLLRLPSSPVAASFDQESFEALLRSTLRRAFSEHRSGPFEDPDILHRSLWRLQALFSSRSYEEVIEEKLQRFRIVETLLLDRRLLSLISFASSNPARHAHPRRLETFARRLASRLFPPDREPLSRLGLSHGRTAIVRQGSFSLLVAISRGEPDATGLADLDFIHRRIEQRFRIPFQQGQPLLREIQPSLEDCLLIHSPSAPAHP